MLAAKQGLAEFRGESDSVLTDDLFALLQRTETDMSIFFRQLADPRIATDASPEAQLAALAEAWYAPHAVHADVKTATLEWLSRYLMRVASDPQPTTVRRAAMNAVNPRYVLRNYLAQLAIDDAEQGDTRRLLELFETLRHPCTEQPGKNHLAAKRPDWARQRAGCSMLSCSS